MELLHLTKSSFDEVINEKGVVLVDFWAPWCGPCKALGPIIDELAKEADGYKVAKVNADEEDELLERYGIASIPTVLIFKDGQVVDKNLGLTNKSSLLALIEKHK